MNPTHNLETPENWDLASRGYADKVAPVMMRTYAEALVERLDVSPDMEALEVAAGSGALTEVLAGRVKSLLATDFSPKMVEILRERLHQTGVTNVRCKLMDGQALDLADRSFDRAACCFALMLFPDRGKGFSELRRVLRPGGRAVVSAWAGPDKFEALGLFLEAMRAAFPEMPTPAAMPVFSLADPADFKAQMEKGGFSDVEVELVTRELKVAGAKEMWEMLTVGAPPVRVLLDRVGTEGQQRLRDVLVGIVDDRYGSGPIRLTNTATVGVGLAN